MQRVQCSEGSEGCEGSAVQWAQYSAMSGVGAVSVASAVSAVQCGAVGAAPPHSHPNPSPNLILNLNVRCPILPLDSCSSYPPRLGPTHPKPNSPRHACIISQIHRTHHILHRPPRLTPSHQVLYMTRSCTWRQFGSSERAPLSACCPIAGRRSTSSSPSDPVLLL